MSDERFRNAVEAALFAAGRPLSVDDLLVVFVDSDWRPERKDVAAMLAQTVELWSQRALELVEVAGGWRFQVRREYSAHLGRLWSEKPPRYSRALLETLAIIAYRQPVTRGEIEEVRGVAVSPSILKTLHERDWIRVLGHKEIPGRPELLGTTRQFLDDFSLGSLEGLPPLAEIRDLDSLPDDLFPETRPGGVPGAQPQPAVGVPEDNDVDATSASDEDGTPSDEGETTTPAGTASEEVAEVAPPMVSAVAIAVADVDLDEAEDASDTPASSDASRDADADRSEPAAGGNDDSSKQTPG